MIFYQKTAEETFSSLNTSPKGITSNEANKRLLAYGPNQLEVKGEPLWKKLAAPFSSLMMLVLVAAGGVSLWQREFVDAIIIFAIIMISAVIDWFQQWSTERILRSLRHREHEDVEVYRDNIITRVKTEHLVCGDIIILQEGQKIPADARLIESNNLHVDESMLTGESLSVKKTTKQLKGDREVYNQLNMLFSGSFVVTGSGIAAITAIGNDTEFGRLAKLASKIDEKSPVQKKIDDIIRKVILAVFVLAGITLVLELIRGIELVEALRFILAFSVSAVPEGLPVAIAVVLALGMRRMAEEKALVRNMRAIENIGLVTTIATDKTGTLTRNELRVQDVWSPRFNPQAFALQTAFSLNMTKGSISDPLDNALLMYAQKYKVNAPHNLANAELVQVLPFDYRYSMSGNVWRFEKKFEVYVKGAPEKIINQCKMSAAEEDNAMEQLHSFAGKGFRVIAFAQISLSDKIDKLSEIPVKKMKLIGLMAIADELRPRVEAAIRESAGAGVQVRMITGDHSETAYHIAKKIGIANDSLQVYDSRRLMKLNPSELATVVENTRVYARVIPEAKHLILNELNKTDITAMTGDGVNDVPALSRAHVGISMGSGAAIAKDASDIVLLDNNFRSIVTAVHEGRTIVANIRRILVYLLATNAGEVLTTIGALLIGLPLPVLAVQILWINLVTDTFMVIPLGLEPGNKNDMKHPPAKANAPILSNYLISRIVLAALAMSIISLTVFVIFLSTHGEAEARSATFLVLVVIQWINAIAMRGEAPVYRLLRIKNRAFTFALIAAIIVQVVVMLTPFSSILHLNTIHADSWLACLVAAIVMLAIIEIHKYIGRRNHQNIS